MVFNLRRVSPQFLAFMLMISLLAGCAARSYLIVDYRLPTPSKALKHRSVRIHVKDLRATQKVFAPAAAEQFDGFKGRYSLVWIANNNQRTPAGEGDLKNLFRQAFQKRLQEMSVTVEPDSQENVPVFGIVIRQFVIDLKDHKWIANVSYEANLSRDNQLIARETITGQAERLKIIGRKGADAVISEIFTEILNRVDILKLFEQAKLV